MSFSCFLLILYLWQPNAIYGFPFFLPSHNFFLFFVFHFHLFSLWFVTILIQYVNMAAARIRETLYNLHCKIDFIDGRYKTANVTLKLFFSCCCCCWCCLNQNEFRIFVFVHFKSQQQFLRRFMNEIKRTQKNFVSCSVGFFLFRGRQHTMRQWLNKQKFSLQIFEMRNRGNISCMIYITWRKYTF